MRRSMFLHRSGFRARAIGSAGNKGGHHGGGGFLLNGVSSVTGAWSLSRDISAGFNSTRYTKSGTDIITIEEQSGNNRDLTDQGTATRRPAEMTAGPNSILCADFNGTDDFLDTAVAQSSFTSASSGAIVASVIIDAVSLNNGAAYQNHGVACFQSTFGAGIWARNASGVTLYGHNYDGTSDQASVTGATGTPYVVMWRHHGGNVYVSINGGAESAVASGDTQTMTGNFRVGVGGGGTNCNMKLFECFITSDGSQTAALATAIANMKAWIGA